MVSRLYPGTRHLWEQIKGIMRELEIDRGRPLDCWNLTDLPWTACDAGSFSVYLRKDDKSNQFSCQDVGKCPQAKLISRIERFAGIPRLFKKTKDLRERERSAGAFR